MQKVDIYVCFLLFFLCAYKTVTDEDEEEMNSEIFKVKPALLVRIKLAKVAVCTKRGREAAI